MITNKINPQKRKFIKKFFKGVFVFALFPGFNQKNLNTKKKAKFNWILRNDDL